MKEMTQYQTERLNRQIAAQKDHILKIERLSTNMFVITYKEGIAIPVTINAMGVLKSFAYDMVYHSEFMQSVKSS